MNSLLNRFSVWVCKLTSHLPFWALFILGDIFFFFLFHVICYRRKVVFENLTNSFPEKSSNEIRKIAKKFYHHLSDISLETLKSRTMSAEQFDERMIIHGLEIYDEYYKQGKGLILLGMHYGNWEWIGSMQRLLNLQFYCVVNQMRSNPEFEEFLTLSRERFGAITVPSQLSARLALRLNQNERPAGIMLAADQTGPSNSQFWTTFLNQETSFFTGPMKIAIKTNQPVILFHSRKIGRSRYEVFHYKLVENPAEVEPDEIMQAYVRKIEEIIKAEPEYWLWSHRRWKHKRPENIPLR